MIGNTRDGWGWPARTFHWIVAAMVLGLFAQGLLMEDLARDARLFNIWLHAAVGITLLVVAALGFVWWLANAAPTEPAGTPAWQHHAARHVHWGLYALIFATVIAGWALAGTMRDPVAIQLFGVIEVPQLVTAGSGLHEFLEEAHEIAAYALIALASAHVTAALYHHFMLRDAVLWRMLGLKFGPKPNPENG